MAEINAKVFDRFEQILLITAGIWLIIRLWPEDITYTYIDIYLLLFSESVAVLFVLLRRSTQDISLRFRDWAAAITGSAGPLFVGAGGEPIAYNFGVALLFLGIIIHIAAKLSLNFSFGIVAANRGVKSSGVYYVVRHPMYLGYMLSHSGYLLAAPSWRNLAIYTIVWTAFVIRILAEERVLMKDPAYRKLAERTRWRLVPFVF